MRRLRIAREITAQRTESEAQEALKRTTFIFHEQYYIYICIRWDAPHHIKQHDACVYTRHPGDRKINQCALPLDGVNVGGSSSIRCATSLTTCTCIYSSNIRGYTITYSYIKCECVQMSVRHTSCRNSQRYI